MYTSEDIIDSIVDTSGNFSTLEDVIQHSYSTSSSFTFSAVNVKKTNNQKKKLKSFLKKICKSIETNKAKTKYPYTAEHVTYIADKIERVSSGKLLTEESMKKINRIMKKYPTD